MQIRLIESGLNQISWGSIKVKIKSLLGWVSFEVGHYCIKVCLPRVNLKLGYILVGSSLDRTKFGWNQNQIELHFDKVKPG